MIVASKKPFVFNIFVEKPNYENAKKYFEQGNYLWNAGVFAFKNKNMIHCFEQYAPDILSSCRETIYNSSFTSTVTNLSELYFSQCRSISVDYAIMEKLCNDTENNKIRKITIPYLSHWNDIGSFSALYNELVKEESDHNKNVLKGDVHIINTTNSYIESDKLVATIGIDNLIIIDTDDALLVCHKDKSQGVKRIVDELKNAKREEASIHTKVFRPWGYYINVHGDDKSGFKIKTIVVYPRKRLSLQSHNYRSEHWVIVKGNAKVQVDNTEYLLNKDEHIYIPIQTLHRIENVGMDLLEFTETQIGNYLGEDDIIRYEDDFGRV
jgi:mannose-1-phosphate guanylyltransferase/mannose-1-phosphate guanylyltransferase/mannose-6-phosphate isomerase